MQMTIDRFMLLNIGRLGRICVNRFHIDDNTDDRQ